MSNVARVSKRAQWIDVAKFMAIIAVMIDHTSNLLYTDKAITYFSYFSVSLFILVMGITTMWSYNSDGRNVWEKTRRKCLGIIGPYIVATFVYGILKYGELDFEVMFEHIIRFNISGPFYYVLLYVQLVLVSPILFYIFEKAETKSRGVVIELFAFLTVLLISWWTTNYSNILGVHGGGGKLFGGTYLILFYIGMWFGKYSKRISLSPFLSGTLATLFGILAVVWGRFVANDKLQIDTMIPFGDGVNPPSISLGLYAILIAATLYFLESALIHFPSEVPMKAMGVLAFFGKHTLYIFLYHRLIIDIVIPRIIDNTGMTISNILIKRIVYFACMIGSSMIIECVFKKIYKEFRTAFKYNID